MIGSPFLSLAAGGCGGGGGGGGAGGPSPAISTLDTVAVLFFAFIYYALVLVYLSRLEVFE